MKTYSLDEWVELLGKEKLRDQIKTHVEQFIESSEKDEVDSLVRLIMTSIRQDSRYYG